MLQASFTRMNLRSIVEAYEEDNAVAQSERESNQITKKLIHG